MADAGKAPDPWQARLLRDPSPRTLLLCSRQAGKSLAASALALHAALLEPGSLVLLLSPTLRQSGELFRTHLKLYAALGEPVPAEHATALSLTLQNGSRVVSLPGNEEGIRGFSGVRLLVIDEAARVPDDLYYAVRPMLAVSGGWAVALSTPFGKRGWFHDEWHDAEARDRWDRTRITAAECPRITAEFLAEERLALGDRWYDQEYFCVFQEATDSLFRQCDIDRAFRPDVEPWKVGEP